MAQSNRRFPPLDLGPLPIDIVGQILKCTLKPGMVHFSAVGQNHSFERHGDDFHLCIRHAAEIVRAPEFIGQSPRYTDAFEMLRAVGDGAVLIAIQLLFTGGDYYPVNSVYRVSRGTIMRRLRTGHLFRADER